MDTRVYRTARFCVGALAVGLATAACDNPVEPEEHPEAGGVVILAAGTNTVLALSVGSVVAFDRPLELEVGQTLEVEVKFLDAANTANLTLAFDPHEDEGESLNVIVANTAVVEYHDHGDHGDFEANAAGETTVQFELMHGSHADFRSGSLIVVVEQPSAGS